MLSSSFSFPIPKPILNGINDPFVYSVYHWFYNIAICCPSDWLYNLLINRFDDWFHNMIVDWFDNWFNNIVIDGFDDCPIHKTCRRLKYMIVDGLKHIVVDSLRNRLHYVIIGRFDNSMVEGFRYCIISKVYNRFYYWFYNLLIEGVRNFIYSNINRWLDNTIVKWFHHIR